MLYDTFNRIHDYLRISLTDNCNLRCFYCMPDENYIHSPTARMMQKDEVVHFAEIFTRLGVRKIRLTGGEPLLRKDAAEIILSISALPVELTLTTNGTRLPEYFGVLKQAGVRTINVSLDSLRPETFNLITRRNHQSRVIDYILLALDSGFRIKINTVIMHGINDSEINDFVRWTRDVPVHVRFIEFMPFEGNRWSSNQVVTLGEMLEEIGREFEYQPLSGGLHETDKKFTVPGHAGTFAVISPMSAPFCGDCNRMRLTVDGKMKNCLFSTGEVDLLTPLRNGEDPEPLIRKHLMEKAEKLGGQFDGSFKSVYARTLKNRSMITIGG
jgi:GTP 3',8-cyclase